MKLTKSYLKSLIKECINEVSHKGLIVHVISIGIINIRSGKTKYGWSIYEDPKAQIYICSRNPSDEYPKFLLYGAPNSLKVGDVFTFIGNDSGMKLGESKVVDICEANSQKLIDLLYTYKMDYKPKRAFQKSAFNNNAQSLLQTSYSIKGVELR